MTRDVARRLLFLLLRASSASAAIVVASGAIPACYTGGGGGTDPPTTTFYFPVGLAVSAGGNALYAVNSDFDLQWNGGTLQSYDLFLIRRDTAALIRANLTGQSPGVLAAPPYNLQFVQAQPTSGANCLTNPRVTNPDGTRVALGEICAPPVQSTNYVRSSAIIGAFATQLQLQTAYDDTTGNTLVGHRLFAPVRGDATVTWADVGVDDPTMTPPESTPSALASWPPFVLDCGQSGNGTSCDAAHKTGNTPDPADTRLATMPGEPFGMALSQDGTAIAVTHQTSTDTSLLTSGFLPPPPPPPPMTTTTVATQTALDGPANPPSMQFVETDVDNGGDGIAAIPHDPDSTVPPCKNPPTPGVQCVGQAFLETNHDTPELDLLRYYTDDGSSLQRPFLSKEAVFGFTTNNSGTDSRGIAIDPTQRIACKAMAMATATGTATTAGMMALEMQLETCADLPARVFFANRTPPSVIFGTIGGPSPNGDGSYDPDLFTQGGNLPLPVGPSMVYVAPIVNAQGNYEVRIFVVDFDSSTISVIDPNHIDLALVQTIYVGPGPFAMAFDPFKLQDVATNAHVTKDTRQTQVDLNTYRFAYVASFTQSFVQVIDLDQQQPTFESVVYTLGNPTPPKGS